MRLTTVWCAALLAVAVPGCKKKDKGEADNSAPKTTTPDKGPDTMAGSGQAGAMPAPAAAAAPKPVTGDDLAKRYGECWGFWNAKDFKSLETCFAKDVTSDQVDSGMPPFTTAQAITAGHEMVAAAFPDRKGDVEVTLINGSNGATVALFTGTNTGAMKTPAGEIPATNKKVGLQVAHVVHFTGDGKSADKEWFYQDMGEMMGQLGLSKAPVRPAADKPTMANQIVIAKDDDTEKKNLASAQKLMDSFNQRDLKGMSEQFDDKLVWSEQGVAKDWTSKADTLKAHEGLLKAFSDMKFTSDAMWAAGDFVAWQGVMTGTNDGAAPDMGLPKKTGKPVSLHFFQLLEYGKDGKLTHSWGFWNSAAFAVQLGLAPPPAAAGDHKAADKPAKAPLKH